MGRILEFLIFHRNGTCLCDLDEFTENFSQGISNKVITGSSNKENEHRYKLIYGMLFSMKSFVKTLSPSKEKDALRTFTTADYKLHYIEFANGLRFIFLTEPMSDNLGDDLRYIHKAFYTSLISKNIFVSQEEQIKNAVFLEKVYRHIINLNKTLANEKNN